MQTANPNVIVALKDEQALLQEKPGLTNEEMQRFVDTVYEGSGRKVEGKSDSWNGIEVV